jgi:hypothetical protein
LVAKKLLRESAGIAQLVERNLAKVEVAGSNPVSRSNIKAQCLRHCAFFVWHSFFIYFSAFSWFLSI